MMRFTADGDGLEQGEPSSPTSIVCRLFIPPASAFVLAAIAAILQGHLSGKG